MARVLGVDPEPLLSLGPKFDSEAFLEQVDKNPQVGVLFRKLQSGQLTPEQIEKMLSIATDGEGTHGEGAND